MSGITPKTPKKSPFPSPARPAPIGSQHYDSLQGLYWNEASKGNAQWLGACSVARDVVDVLRAHLHVPGGLLTVFRLGEAGAHTRVTEMRNALTPHEDGFFGFGLALRMDGPPDADLIKPVVLTFPIYVRVDDDVCEVKLGRQGRRFSSAGKVHSSFASFLYGEAESAILRAPLRLGERRGVLRVGE